jgi:hypothetical protein
LELKETGRNSNRFDFLLKYASQEGNVANTLTRQNNCPLSKRIFEYFKLYVWFIFVPIAATIITFFTAAYVLRLGPGDASTLTSTILMGVVSTAAPFVVFRYYK